MTDELEVFENGEERVYQQVREILTSARSRVYRVINDGIVAVYPDQKGVLDSLIENQANGQSSEFIRDPYALHLIGLHDPSKFVKTDLHSALLTKFEKYLLELDKGFALIGRREHLTLDGQHFYVDLVFYNRLTRCFVLIDLKTGELTHQDLGQMQMYVHYYQRERMVEGENPPIGIVLCTDKNDAVVRYTLPEGDNQIFAARYQLHLPTEEELAREIQQEHEIIERECRLAEESK